MSRNLRKLFANIIGCFIRDKWKRRRIRTNITVNLPHCKRFVRKLHPGISCSDMKVFYGGGAKALLIAVNTECIYKFSCLRNGNFVAQKEYDVIQYFKDKLPVYIPEITLLKDGKNLVRKYEYIHDTLLSTIPKDIMLKNTDYLAKQIAEILYIMNKEDPECLKYYKTEPNEKPGMFYGWNHGDFINTGNIFVNPKTLQITALIDWENVKFADMFIYMNKSKETILKPAIICEYKKLWTTNK